MSVPASGSMPITEISRIIVRKELMFEHLGMWTWPDAINVGDPALMAERLDEAGIDINIPYLCARSGGAEKAAYETRLHAIIEEAHRKGQKVHGCFDELNAYEAMPSYDLRQAHKDGSLNNTLCPANPRVVDYVLGELERSLLNIDLDGISLEDGYVFHHSSVYDPAHLEDAGYRVEPVCYCDYCVKNAPIGKPEWGKWKQGRLSDLVGAQSKLVRQLKPGLPFSAAGRLPYRSAFYEPYQNDVPYYGGWKLCQSRDGFSADWVEWLRRGYLDFACPMTYFHNDRIVELTIAECRHEVPRAAELAWIGLGLGEVNAEYVQGVPANEDGAAKTYDPALLNDAAAIARQMQLQLGAGQRNCLFFSYAFLSDEHISAIASFGRAGVARS